MRKKITAEKTEVLDKEEQDELNKELRDTKKSSATEADASFMDTFLRKIGVKKG